MAPHIVRHGNEIVLDDGTVVHRRLARGPGLACVSSVRCSVHLASQEKHWALWRE